MDAIEDIGCYLQQFLYEEVFRYFAGLFIDIIQHLSISLEGLLLKLFISIDLVALSFKNPAECLRIHVVNIALIKLERIGRVIEYSLVVNLREMFAEEKLCGLRIFLCFDVIDLVVHFILFVYYLFPMRPSLIGANRISLTGKYEIFLVHEQI